MTQEIKPQIKDNGEGSSYQGQSSKAGGLPFNLQEGRTYITRTGEKVTMSVDKHCKPASDYHQFRGSNGFYYYTNGVVFDDREFELDVVSEVPKITLEHGKTYITAGGEHVTVKAHTDSFTGFYKFKGDNNYRYGLNGDFHPLCYRADNKHIIVSEYKEPQVQPNLYTEAHRDIAEAYRDGLNAGNTFSTSELQSLIQMQSKVITEVEREILELKETAAYLSHNSNSRVQELRKKIYNEITSKNKRLVKVVQLQTKMKRNK